MEYSNTALATIAESALLPAEGMAQLAALAGEIQDTWQKQQMWRTETEARVSVLNPIKHPTYASRYWQCVREQAVFADQLVHLAFDYEKAQAERDALLAEADELNELACQQEGAPFRKHLAQARVKTIEAERITYSLLTMRLAAKDRLREVQMWSDLKAEIVEQATREGAPFDTTDPNTHQLASYLEQFRREAEIAQASGGSPAELRNIVGKLMAAERETHDCQSLLHRDETTLPHEGREPLRLP